MEGESQDKNTETPRRVHRTDKKKRPSSVRRNGDKLLKRHEAESGRNRRPRQNEETKTEEKKGKESRGLTKRIRDLVVWERNGTTYIQGGKDPAHRWRGGMALWSVKGGTQTIAQTKTVAVTDRVRRGPGLDLGQTSAWQRWGS